MRKVEILKKIVAVQAVCMIILTVVVSIKVLGPPGAAKPGRSVQGPAQPAATQPSSGALETGIAAKVGGETITEQEYLAELRREYGDQVLRTMMLRKAVMLEADTYGLKVTAAEIAEELGRLMEGYDDEASYYEAMKRQLGMTKEDVRNDTEYRLLLEKIAVRDVTVTDQEVAEYIRSHPDEFKPATQLRLSWILTETREEAGNVLKMAQSGEDFAALARSYSIDDFTAAGGGDLGLTDEDDPFLNQAMLKAARGMEIGQIGGPVKADGGWAVFRLTERQSTSEPAGSAREEAVRKQLELAAAPPLNEVEDQLLAKYEAATYPQREGAGTTP